VFGVSIQQLPVAICLQMIKATCIPSATMANE
jgi:hypothetical protein